MVKPKSQVNVPKRSVNKAQSRRPRILWAMPFCLLDTSSGANISIRAILRQLVLRGYEVTILGATIFDSPKGANSFKQLLGELRPYTGKVVSVDDVSLTHHLFVTKNTFRGKMLPKEEGQWHSAFVRLLDAVKPDMVGYYGGHPLEMMIAYEARLRGVPSLFYLVNGNYQARRWCQDVDLIVTDTQETSKFYRDKVGFTPVPIGKFIEEEQFVAEERHPERLLFVNPSLAKGASVVVQLALTLEQERPDIQLEVLESRGDWEELVEKVTSDLGTPRTTLNNVVITGNTRDMRSIYGRARVLLAPSLWWESGARVLAEAMLNGIPAVVSNYGGSPEMIGNGGIVIDFSDECHTEPYYHLLDDVKIEEIVQNILPLFDDESLYQSYVSCAERVGREKHHIDVSTDRFIKVINPLLKRRDGNRIFRAMVEKRHRHGLTWGVSSNEAYWPESFSEVTINIANYKNTDDVAGNSKPHEPKKNKTKAVIDDQLEPEGDGSGSTAADVIKRPEETEIDWQLESQVVVLDNRAKLVKTGAVHELVKTKAFNIIAFDPASEVADHPDNKSLDNVQIFQHALLGDGEQSTLNVCLDGERTSVLTPIQKSSFDVGHQKSAEVIAQLPINTVALNSIDGLPSLDWLILDELSESLKILEYGDKILQDVLLIQARVQFCPTHLNQPSFSELQQWADDHGYRFYRFNDLRYGSTLVQTSSDIEGQASVLESADILFLPTEDHLNLISASQLRKLAFLLHTVFGARDVAHIVLQKKDQCLADQYHLHNSLGAESDKSNYHQKSDEAAKGLNQEEILADKLSLRATPKERLDPGEKGIFIDCGGYDGCSAVKFSLNNHAFDIVSFEPNPALWAYYDDVPTSLVKKAAFTYDGVIQLTLDNLDEDGSSIVPGKKIDFTGHRQNSEFPSIEAECIDITRYIAVCKKQYDKIILKLDIEGAEYDILEGLIKKDLMKDIDKLYCEFHWHKCGISKTRHDRILRQAQAVSDVLDWDALDFSVHKRNKKNKAMRHALLSRLPTKTAVMSCRNDLILHVGMHRTGTTTLQEHFFPRFPNYLGRCKRMYGRWGYNDCSTRLLALSKKPNYEKVNDFFDSIQHAIEDNKGQSFILSNEALIEPPELRLAPFTADGRAPDGEVRSPIYGMLEKMEALRPGSIQVIFIVRRQADWLASFYSRISGEISSASQEDFDSQVGNVLNYNIGWVDWSHWVAALIDILGRPNVLCLPMEMMTEDGFWEKLSQFIGAELDPRFGNIETKENQFSLGEGRYRIEDANRNGQVNGFREFELSASLIDRVQNDHRIVRSNHELENIINVDLRSLGYY